MRLQKKISTLVHRYVPSNLTLSDSGVIIASSAGINLLMFAYNAYLGRKLVIADFGLIAFIGSLLNVLYIPLGSFARTITHQTAYLFGKYNLPNKMIWKRYRRISLAISLVITLAWIATIPMLKIFFSVSESMPFVLLTPLWLVSIAAAVDAGYLAGIHRFKQLSLIDLIDTICLLAVTVVLIETQTSQFLYAAITLSTIISFALGWTTIVRINTKQIHSRHTQPLSFPWNFYHHSLATKLASVAFINIDVILAKHYLSPQGAGEYALLALVGKMIFFVSTLLGQFVVPIVSKQVGNGQNPKRVFTQIFGVTLAIVALGYIGVGLFGAITLPVLFGEKALTITKHLPWYALGMACFGLTHLLLSYYQSLHRYAYTATSIVASALIIVGIMFFHASVADISTVVGMAGVSSLAMVALMRFWFKLDTQLINLTISTLVAKFYPFSSKSVFLDLPQTAGIFTLTRVFKKPAGCTDYQFGIYENAHGRKALGKFWHGHTKDAAFYRLQNEVVATRAIERADKKIERKWGKYVAVPHIVHTQTTKKSLLILFEWVEADSKSKEKNASAWVRTFADIHSYYQALSKTIQVDTDNGLSSLSKRTGTHMLLIYPIALWKACRAHPKQRPLLLHGARVFLQGLPQLLRQKQLVLTHCDLHPANIRTHNQKAYVIDHAHCLFTLVPYDQLATIILNWTSRELRSGLLNELQETITTKSYLRLIKLLGVYISTLYLMDGNRADLRAQKYHLSLNYWVHSLRSHTPLNQQIYHANTSYSLLTSTGQ